LIELAIINGKYKQEAAANNFQNTLNQILMSQAANSSFILTTGLNPAHINQLNGAPILISPGLDTSSANGSSGSSSQSVTPTNSATSMFTSGMISAAAANGALDQSGLIYAPLHALYQHDLPTYIEYPNTGLDFSQAGMFYSA
jgi:hypothetical protein